ncbi:MAG: type II secretion system F family protein [Tatlockia sp.]|nr:type II secretion system F family protein [Tatlockia sp.]
MNKLKQSYFWQGINERGVISQGIIEADSITLAKKELGTKAIRVKKIKRKVNPVFSKKISQADITLFSRQLATMQKAGISLTEALDFVAKSQTNLLLKSLVMGIKNEVTKGYSLSEVLLKYPNYFNELFCNLIAAGEKSGKLDVMLDRVASYNEKIELIKSKVKKALAYPLIVLLISILVTLALLIYVVPEFESLFNGFGAELPALTSLIITISRKLTNNWPIFLGFTCALIWLLLKARLRYVKLKDTIDEIILRLPILGSLLSKAIIVRFSRTLAVSFEAGLPLIESLGAVSAVVVNKIYEKATFQIRTDLFSGQPLHIAMKNTNLFPPMAVQMVAIGEESGTLGFMLEKIAIFYEEDLNSSLEISLNLLEPIMMSILGLIIGSLVIAMYLPIFKLGSVV